MNYERTEIKTNLSSAKARWGVLSRSTRAALAELTSKYEFSIPLGDVLLLSDRWYVTNAGLLRLAAGEGCNSIQTRLLSELCDRMANRWFFKATVYKSVRSRGFVGYGDADPSNVSPLVRGAEMRVAETRAVNRALRKAYGIGLCSVEELGYVAPASSAPRCFEPHSNAGNGNDLRHNEPRLRDRLCLLIRQHHLDPALVKAYAADFCGTAVLKDAGRELVESFIAHLAQAAKEDRDALVCKLNSYIQPKEVRP